MDHWSNIDVCIDILLGNLSFNTPGPVYQASIEILQEIVNEARSGQTLPILKALDTAHCRWRDSYEGGPKQSDGKFSKCLGAVTFMLIPCVQSISSFTFF